MTPPVEVCPRCKKGKRVECVYALKDSGLVMDDSYCGWCGRNWPKALKREPERA